MLVKKGDVLFRVDPTPYQLDVNVLEAQLVNAQASQRELEESAKGAEAKVAESRGAIEQAASRTREVSAQLDLARKRVEQYRELAKTGAGSTLRSRAGRDRRSPSCRASSTPPAARRCRRAPRKCRRWRASSRWRRSSAPR